MQRLTKRASPTTTGKIERWHRTLREEFLDHAGPFESIDAAQQAIDAWTHTYNYSRPHQSLNMATPASLFRPVTATFDSPRELGADTVPGGRAEPAGPGMAIAAGPVVMPADGGDVTPAVAPAGAGALTYQVLVPPSGSVSVLQVQTLWLGPAFAGRHVTIWVDIHSLHVALDGQHIKTVPSRLRVEQLGELARRGATPAGLPPSAAALPRGRTRLPAGHSVELERVVGRDGIVRVANQSFVVSVQLTGQRIALRLDGRLMHAIADGRVIKTWPMAIAADKLTALSGAHAPGAALPIPQPVGAIRAQRRVPVDGVVMIARQRLRIGRQHAGKTISIVVEDNHFRILAGEQELPSHARTTTHPVTRFSTRRRPSSPNP